MGSLLELPPRSGLTEFLRRGIKYGFRIGSTAPHNYSSVLSLRSTAESEEVVHEYLKNELLNKKITRRKQGSPAPI